MRYTNCCKSTRKNKKCIRKDGKHFSLQRRFSKKKCIKGPVKGFTMRASCAPYKFCKQKGGAKKTRKLLPKLRKISYKNKKHHYRLKDPFRKRKLAIHEGVNREAKKTGKTRKKAAIAKKGRFNILRIYRKNKKIKECNTITQDMKYMDRKYGLGKTKNICGQKGGNNPILFRGKEELIQRIREQIGPDNEGAIFETEEIINFTERNWGRDKKIYIKREDLENLGIEPANSNFQRLWHQTNIIPSYAIDDNGMVSVHRQDQMQALNAGPIVYGSVRIKKKDEEWFISQDINAGLNSGGYKKKSRKKRGGKRKKSRKRIKNKRKKTRKKQFLYNPDDPSKSFDVYIDKNPNDTIPIKYTTVKDIKDTIKKLERLYKSKKYLHKRIWQVGMIMKVRLEAMLKHKTKKYPNAKKVKQRFNLANKYFKFLGKRTKKNDFKSRKAMTFKF